MTDIAEIRRAKAAELALVYSDPDSALHARMAANWARRQEALTRMLIRRLDRHDGLYEDKRLRHYAMARMDAALDRMYAAQAVEDRAMHRRWAVRWAHAAMVS
ncbi:hypothetical protein [Azotobacter chroococcum]|uniref:hypothetical protein n=1 Tax=Azotobacter chroococcum TaxID=353 RepID=UPI0010AE4D7D|nr:hypothetical protein [Azotobacter chroococcum]TKD44217.1 hypothetical protein FCG41_07435 [Azotobacter chroococcum]